ncbi:MAG: hypothetical protein F6K50_15410 [Moorea sp. SIO3I7]|uniref:hypothetical protein n=1 Tax=Moorena sp. SIO3I8 TaxID=2607833 RepID=UPI0013C25E84|nr:hypothetical protein [Moorena sp. SIO3I8]NEN96867.1 hypothetical protein [Moorena sp. SIO3I7]NEO04942.1 hypothetical protein [Moorena sp. SIO3I8]
MRYAQPKAIGHRPRYANAPVPRTNIPIRTRSHLNTSVNKLRLAYGHATRTHHSLFPTQVHLNPYN